MLVFRLLSRITQSSDAHRTESVSVMDHKQTMNITLQKCEQFYKTVNKFKNFYMRPNIVNSNIKCINCSDDLIRTNRTSGGSRSGGEN